MLRNQKDVESRLAKMLADQQKEYLLHVRNKIPAIEEYESTRQKIDEQIKKLNKESFAQEYVGKVDEMRINDIYFLSDLAIDLSGIEHCELTNEIYSGIVHARIQLLITNPTGKVSMDQKDLPCYVYYPNEKIVTQEIKGQPDDFLMPAIREIEEIANQVPLIIYSSKSGPVVSFSLSEPYPSKCFISGMAKFYFLAGWQLMPFDLLHPQKMQSPDQWQGSDMSLWTATWIKGKDRLVHVNIIRMGHTNKVVVFAPDKDRAQRIIEKYNQFIKEPECKDEFVSFEGFRLLFY